MGTIILHDVMLMNMRDVIYGRPRIKQMWIFKLIAEKNI